MWKQWSTRGGIYCALLPKLPSADKTLLQNDNIWDTPQQTNYTHSHSTPINIITYRLSGRRIKIKNHKNVDRNIGGKKIQWTFKMRIPSRFYVFGEARLIIKNHIIMNICTSKVELVDFEKFFWKVTKKQTWFAEADFYLSMTEFNDTAREVSPWQTMACIWLLKTLGLC